MSSMFRRVRLPGPVLVDERVGQDNKLSCHSDEGGFGCFAVVNQAFIEVFGSGIEAFCGEGGEIEDTPQGRPSAPNDTTPIALAGVIGDRSKPRQHGNGLGITSSKFGQAGKKRCGNNKAKARNGDQDLIPPGETLVSADAFEK